MLSVLRVEKEKLHGSLRRGLDALLVHDAGADLERGGAAAGRRALALGVDRSRGPHLLGEDRRREQRSASQEERDGLFQFHAAPQNLSVGPALTCRSRMLNTDKFDTIVRYCTRAPKYSWSMSGMSRPSATRHSTLCCATAGLMLGSGAKYTQSITPKLGVSVQTR